MIVTVQIIRPVRIPAGAMLDGKIVDSPTWVRSGRHDIDADTMQKNEWDTRGFVAPEKVDGQPFVWHSCC